MKTRLYFQVQVDAHVVTSTLARSLALNVLHICTPMIIIISRMYIETQMVHLSIATIDRNPFRRFENSIRVEYECRDRNNDRWLGPGIRKWKLFNFVGSVYVYCYPSVNSVCQNVSFMPTRIRVYGTRVCFMCIVTYTFEAVQCSVRAFTCNY